MKRIRIVGLCLVAVFAFSALVATAAQAAELEYGNAQYTTGCTKAAKTADNYEKVKPAKGKNAETRTPASKKIAEGKYANKTCTELAANPGKWDGIETEKVQNIEYKGPEGKYELGSAVGVRLTTSRGPVKLYIRGGGNPVVECASSTGEEEIVASNVTTDAVTFKGCSIASAGSCTGGGAGAGEIKAEAFGFLVSYEGKALRGTSGHNFDFTCGHLDLEVTDEGFGVISGNLNEVPKNFKTSSPFAVDTFAVNAGHEQLPLGTGHELTTSVYNEETSEYFENLPVGLETIEEIKSTTPLEVHI